MRGNQGPVPQIGDQKERVTIDIKNFATTAGCEEVASVGFAELAAWIAEHLRVESAVLDGEIACVDDDGRPVFRDLLFRRR
jgi:hypothetical protein